MYSRNRAYTDRRNTNSLLVLRRGHGPLTPLRIPNRRLKHDGVSAGE
jgi:hypothetical protein